jgi:hypothetical protein
VSSTGADVATRTTVREDAAVRYTGNHVYGSSRPHITRV